MRTLAIVLAWLLAASVAQAAPTRNGTGGITLFAAATSVSSTAITVAAGSNTVLIVGLANSFGMTAPSCTWDNAGTPQTMTLIGGGSTALGAIPTLFGLRNPHTGNLTLACSWTGSSGGSVSGQAYNGVDVTSDANAFKNQATNAGTSTTDTLAITNVTSGVVVDLGTTTQTIGNAGTQATLQFDETSTVAAALGEQFGAGSLTATWSITPSAVWSDQGVSLAPAPASAGGKNIMMMGQ